MSGADAGLDQWLVPARFHRLFDDGSAFPPVGLTLEQSLSLHVEHALSPYRQALGPLIVRDEDLDEFAELSSDLPDQAVWLAVLVADVTDVGDALARAARVRTARLAGAEVTMPDTMAPDRIVPCIEAAMGAADILDPEIYVEVPRDERRPHVFDALAASDFDAKLRTGGSLAAMAPDDEELADAVIGAVTRHLPFKATAGLHHAVRTTDPDTGLHHHGFLNILLAVDTARQGVDVHPSRLREQVIAALAERRPAVVADGVRRLPPERALAARSSFSSFGVSSVLAPLAELIDLGLVVTAHP